jgi:hypothetical protein
MPPVADYYIYLPVYDLDLAKVAQKWKTGGEEKTQKTYEVIERRSTGFKKWVSRKIMRGALKNVPPVATVYVLAHGYSAGRNITGLEVEARAKLSEYGADNYSYLKNRYPKACEACEKEGYADPKDGDTALDAALDDDASYDAVVKLFASSMEKENATIVLERPGALKIGGTRPDGSSRTYTPADFYKHLKKEKLPQVPRLKIFACNSGISPLNETRSFAEQLYELMKTDYPNTKVYGYLGALNGVYGAHPAHKNGQIPANSSEIWGEFHQDGGNSYGQEKSKGVRIIKPDTREVVAWGSTNQEEIPAHILRVEFPGGKSITGDMVMQDYKDMPW